MKKYTCVIFAKHPGDFTNKPYLFSVDPITDIKSGQQLCVSTKKGTRDAVAVGSSFLIDERGLDSLISATGAYLPLKPVIGTVEEKLVRKAVLHKLCDTDLPF